MFRRARAELAENGFTILPGVFDNATVQCLINTIDQASIDSSNARATAHLFAIRNLLQEVPSLARLLWTSPINHLLDAVTGEGTNCIRAVYFDKPAGSNWVVPWHQDLHISVDRQESVSQWINWNHRHGPWSVQPSADYLESIYTIRIHLDDCDASNGALKVIPASHKLGILPEATIRALDKSQATICTVPKGGVLIMQPLLVHASGKSVSQAHRRVIHLELTDRSLPNGLQWREFLSRSANSVQSQLTTS
ncbi:phytanoyl-CoA dioxygenase family protein [Spirosoma soli]|uniref:Phytanoyl-CoA dioxygenase family protein n=1 Tax=Spirosoma soli TaxID=1770529 RepID=A0ABW5M185_9BACT